MSDDCATVDGTGRLTAVRRIIGAIGAAASVPLLAAAIVAPSPAVVVVLSTCAVVTGILVANSLPSVLVLRAHRHRRRLRRPIRPGSRRALAEFRRQLHSLPETVHPLGR